MGKIIPDIGKTFIEILEKILKIKKINNSGKTWKKSEVNVKEIFNE